MQCMGGQGLGQAEWVVCSSIVGQEGHTRGNS